MATDPAIITDDPADPPADPPPADPAANADPVAPPADPAAPPADPAAPPADPATPDWRTRIAGGDEKVLGWLGRYPSEAAFAKAAKDDRDAIRAGKYIKPLGENATDEEKAAWRSTMGIPEKAEDYLTDLPDGLVIGEDDKEGVDLLVSKLHEAGLPKAAAGAALSTYYALVEQGEAARLQATEAVKSESIEALRGEWGADYKRNLNAMHGYLDTLPEAVQDLFRNGIMPDGTPAGYNAENLKWLTARAMEENPLATVVPGTGANQGQAVADEIAKWEGMMGDRESEYWKGPKADANQKRYLTLIEARDRMK